MNCRHCGMPVASANGIYVHVETGRPDGFKNGFHYAKPIGAVNVGPGVVQFVEPVIDWKLVDKATDELQDDESTE